MSSAKSLAASSAAAVDALAEDAKAARERMRAALQEKARAGRSNPAFERIMRSALNSRTNAILGWTES